jgi:hypothetical protein
LHVEFMTRRFDLNRRAFLKRLGVAAAGAAVGEAVWPEGGQGAVRTIPPLRHSEFVFARLRYDSGDWDYNPKLCANWLDTVLQYTDIPVVQEEVIITADSDELVAFPFLFMTGHTLVRFNAREREGIRRYVESGGFLTSRGSTRFRSSRRLRGSSLNRKRICPRFQTTTPSIPPSSTFLADRRRPAMN